LRCEPFNSRENACQPAIRDRHWRFLRDWPGSGIGLELARCSAQEGLDLLIAADEPEIELAANELRAEEGGRMPGATETEFFRRDMMDTKIGTDEKDDAGDVARAAFDAMMRGDGDIVTGMKNKLQSAVANVTPAETLAKQHRKMAEPGTAKSQVGGKS
jgi:hypothetical protein